MMFANKQAYDDYVAKYGKDAATGANPKRPDDPRGPVPTPPRMTGKDYRTALDSLRDTRREGLRSATDKAGRQAANQTYRTARDNLQAQRLGKVAPRPVDPLPRVGEPGGPPLTKMPMLDPYEGRTPPVDRGHDPNYRPPVVPKGSDSANFSLVPGGMKKGGKVSASKMKPVKTAKPKMSSASKRADGIAQRGKTRGKMV
jgi:hypothetical protein